jgi:hypothetical protein
LSWLFFRKEAALKDALRAQAIHNFSTSAIVSLTREYVHLNTIEKGATSEAIRKLLDELEANRQSRKSAWTTLQRLRKFLEAAGARISIPEDRNFETEGETIESGLRRTIAGRDAVMRSLIRAVYRFRDATLVAEKKADFGNALQNLYRELERAENLVGPSFPALSDGELGPPTTVRLGAELLFG